MNMKTAMQVDFIKPITTVIAVTTAAVLLSACGPKDVDSKEAALTQLNELVSETILPSRRENNYRANIQLTQTNLLSMLPSMSEYPMTLDARDSSAVEAVEIFTSSEKAGTGRDGLYVEMAQAFNRQQLKISNGKVAQIGIRKIASGLGAQFILAQRNTPDAFSPSNHLWGDMLSGQGIPLSLISPVT
ncbi:MAG: VWA domain-containing protein, partial [Pseudomonadota bacterium]